LICKKKNRDRGTRIRIFIVILQKQLKKNLKKQKKPVILARKNNNLFSCKKTKKKYCLKYFLLNLLHISVMKNQLANTVAMI